MSALGVGAKLRIPTSRVRAYFLGELCSCASARCCQRATFACTGVTTNVGVIFKSADTQALGFLCDGIHSKEEVDSIRLASETGESVAHAVAVG